MTTTARTLTATLAAAVLAALLAVGGLGVARAQDDATEDPTTETTDDPTSPERRGELTDEEREARRAERQAELEADLQLFADELGATTEQVQAAALAVLDARLDRAVADGHLTEVEAEEIRTRAEEEGAVLGLLGGKGGPGHHHRGGRGRMGPDGGPDGGPDAPEASGSSTDTPASAEGEA